jgi:hypothetical protein
MCASPARSGSVRARFKGDGLSSAFDCGAAAAEDGLARSAVPISGEETVDHINWYTEPCAVMREWIVSGIPVEPASISDLVRLSGCIGGGVGDTPETTGAGEPG